jgi:hypothetical protein
MIRKIIKIVLISSLIMIFLAETYTMLNKKGNINLHLETFGIGNRENPLDLSVVINGEIIIETNQLTYEGSIDTVLTLPLGFNKLEFRSKDRNIKYETYTFNMIFVWYSFTMFKEKGFSEYNYSIFPMSYI